MNCIIIDDEKTARVILKTLCNEIRTLNVVKDFSSAIKAIKYLNDNDIDLIFLDIYMPDFNGLDFIKTLKKPVNIILTTSDPKFAIDAFEYDFIIDYLLKPIELPRFRKAIIKAKNKFNLVTERTKELELKNDFYVNIDRRLIKIDIHRIFIIEANGDYINIKTEDKNYVVHSTLKKIEKKLPDLLFLKIHRSYIINLKKIIDIEDNSVLINKEILPISRSKKPVLMERLDLL
tara:strand:- start:63426 stop:64124 length:699 start_codon:yes stop_codon:yes gene_type:complete